MTTVEQRLQAILGQQLFLLAVMETKLEEATKRIAELEAGGKANESSLRRPKAGS